MTTVTNLSVKFLRAELKVEVMSETNKSVLPFCLSAYN